MTRTEKIAITIVYALIVTFFVWLFASWVDVMQHQTTGGTDNAWNLFVIGLNWNK